MDNIIVMIIILVGVFILTYCIYGKYIINEHMSEEEQSSTSSSTLLSLQASITALQSQMTNLTTKYDDLSSTVSELQSSSASSTESLNNINSEIEQGQANLNDNFDASAFQ